MQGPVHAGIRQEAPIRAPRDREDRSGVSRKVVATVTLRHIPDPNAAVLCRDGEQVAVRAEGRVGGHAGPVEEARADLPAAPGIPEVRALEARRRQRGVVRRERHALELGPRRQHVQQPAGSCVEDANVGRIGVVFASSVATRRPSGENAPFTAARFSSTATGRPVSVRQTVAPRAVVVSTTRPSRLNTAEVTTPGRCSVWRRSPVPARHSTASRPAAPSTSAPSGEKDAAVTGPATARVRSSLPFVEYTRRPPPASPASIRPPVDANATTDTGPPGARSTRRSWFATSAWRSSLSARAPGSLWAAATASASARSGLVVCSRRDVASRACARARRAALRACERSVRAKTATAVIAPSATSAATASATRRRCRRRASSRSRSMTRRARQARTPSARTSWKIS